MRRRRLRRGRLGGHPIEYFRDVLARISEPGGSARIRDLLPANWKTAADAAQRQADPRLAIANVVRALVYARSA